MLTLRPITPADMEFLYRVYASTRAEELALVDWTAEQKAAFLLMQFHAQHRFYQEQFTQASFQIILLDGQSVGRLYVDRRTDEIHIIDIALLTEQRNQGIGSHLLHALLAEGAQRGLPVRIHVERFNPALRLYQRLGFRQISDDGVYFLMEWRPEAADQPV